jgi:hypothetical protein
MCKYSGKPVEATIDGPCFRSSVGPGLISSTSSTPAEPALNRYCFSVGLISGNASPSNDLVNPNSHQTKDQTRSRGTGPSDTPSYTYTTRRHSPDRSDSRRRTIHLLRGSSRTFTNRVSLGKRPHASSPLVAVAAKRMRSGAQYDYTPYMELPKKQTNILVFLHQVKLGRGASHDGISLSSLDVLIWLNVYLIMAAGGFQSTMYWYGI